MENKIFGWRVYGVIKELKMHTLKLKIHVWGCLVQKIEQHKITAAREHE